MDYTFYIKKLITMKWMIIGLCFLAMTQALEFGIDIDRNSRWCFHEFIGRHFD